LRVLDAFVAAIDDGCASLVLSGPAGIGKSTLWRAGVARARAAGIAVLVARPAATETSFSLGALADLLEQVPPETVDELPAPQRRALRVACSLEEAAEPVEPTLLATATLSCLRAQAAQAPVLVGIDDLQWLDAASSDVLGFAARRLAGERVRVLATRRTGEAGASPSLPEPAERLSIGPLSIGALQRLLAARLEVSLSRHALRRVFDAAAGNPLYALELARSLEGRRPSLRDPVPVPPDLRTLLRARLDRLPSDTRALLLAAALLHDPTLEALEMLTGPGAWGKLEPALAAQAVEADGTRLRFAHPLFAASVVEAADPLETRVLHARIAELPGTPAEQARHLALGSEPPDERIAAALEAAAQHERLRGAVYAAADLAHEAWRFSAESGRRAERLLQACEHRLIVGGFEDVVPQLEPELPALPAGPLRARALFLLARAGIAGPRKSELLDAALAEVGDRDPGLRATILMERMSFLVTGLVATEEAERTLDEAVHFARAAGDPDLEDRCRGNHAWALAALGRTIAPAGRLRTRALSDDVERARAVQLLWRGETEPAGELLLRLLQRAIEAGEEWSQLIFTLHLFELEARRGDWPAARRRQADLVGAAAGIPGAAAVVRRTDALLAAVGGDRAGAESAAAVVAASADRWQVLEAERAAGVAALAAGDPAAAVARLRPVFDATIAAGFRDPGAIPAAPDLVDALTRLGRGDEARAVLDWLEDRSAEQAHPWGLALSARLRGVVDRDEALLRVSLERLEQLALPFERARTLLALGGLLRRARRRAEARAVLAQARVLFEELDAPPWARETMSEEARLGGRTPAGSALTPAEHRVAVLVADGRTKKEAAAELFLSIHTVDSTLRRVYAKLGVRTRAELARHFL
jgi:DNA-binding CsgD family transcriptional regulator